MGTASFGPDTFYYDKELNETAKNNINISSPIIKESGALKHSKNFSFSKNENNFPSF